MAAVAEPELSQKQNQPNPAHSAGAEALMQLVIKPINEIKLNPRNARTYPPKQLRQIEQSIRSFGFRSPLLVDETSTLIAGHGRLAAAVNLGLTELPAIVIEGLSKAQKAGLALADNRIALNAGWDSRC